jgi:hypothetical protein
MYVHYWRYQNEYLIYKVEISAILMLGIFKIVSFAFAFSDGQKPDREIEKYAWKITKDAKKRETIVTETKFR